MIAGTAAATRTRKRERIRLYEKSLTRQENKYTLCADYDFHPPSGLVEKDIAGVLDGRGDIHHSMAQLIPAAEGPAVDGNTSVASVCCPGRDDPCLQTD